jgi:hypothetical protein
VAENMTNLEPNRRIITKHDLLKSVLNKAIQMEQSVQNFKNLFE